MSILCIPNLGLIRLGPAHFSQFFKKTLLLIFGSNDFIVFKTKGDKLMAIIQPLRFDFVKWPPDRTFVSSNTLCNLTQNIFTSIDDLVPNFLTPKKVVDTCSLLSKTILNLINCRYDDSISKRYSKKIYCREDPKKPPTILSFWIKSSSKAQINIQLILPYLLANTKNKKVKVSLLLNLENTSDKWIGKIFRQVLLRYQSIKEGYEYICISSLLHEQYKGHSRRPLPVIHWGEKKQVKLEISLPWLNETISSALVSRSIPLDPFNNSLRSLPPGFFFKVFHDILVFMERFPSNWAFLDIKSENIMVRLKPPTEENASLGYSADAFSGHMIDPDLMQYCFQKIKPSYYLPWDCFAIYGYVLLPDSTSLAIVLAEYLYSASFLQFSRDYYASHDVNFSGPIDSSEIINDKINQFQKFYEFQKVIDNNYFSRLLMNRKEKTLDIDLGPSQGMLQYLKGSNHKFSKNETLVLNELLFKRELHLLILNTLFDNVSLFEIFLSNQELQKCFFTSGLNKIDRSNMAAKGRFLFADYPAYQRQKVSYFSRKFNDISNAYLNQKKPLSVSNSSEICDSAHIIEKILETFNEENKLIGQISSMT